MHNRQEKICSQILVPCYNDSQNLGDLTTPR
jgi:hypothetical protein